MDNNVEVVKYEGANTAEKKIQPSATMKYLDGVVTSSGSSSSNTGTRYFIGVKLTSLGSLKPDPDCFNDLSNKICKSGGEDTYILPVKTAIQPYSFTPIRLAYDKDNNVEVVKYEGANTDPPRSVAHPQCSEYGCAEGRNCKETGDCANGLSCVRGKCARQNPFSEKNMDKRSSVDQDKNDEERNRYEKDLRKAQKKDAADMIEDGDYRRGRLHEERRRYEDEGDKGDYRRGRLHEERRRYEDEGDYGRGSNNDYYEPNRRAEPEPKWWQFWR
jgi:hypothetical protein